MSPEADFFVHPDWREPLERAGLLELAAHRDVDPKDCLSRHRRGWIHRVSLPDGRLVFGKFDALTKVRRIVCDLLRLCRPQPLTFRERAALDLLAAAGFRVPKVLAFMQRRRNFLIPHQAVMILSEVEGVSLIKYMRSPQPAELRQAALAAIGGEVGRLYRAGLQWPDLSVGHVFITPDLRVSFLDVDRLTPRSWGLPRLAARQLAVFLDELARLGATDQELAVFLDGFGQTAPPAIARRVHAAS